MTGTGGTAGSGFGCECGCQYGDACCWSCRSSSSCCWRRRCCCCWTNAYIEGVGVGVQVETDGLKGGRSGSKRPLSEAAAGSADRLTKYVPFPSFFQHIFALLGSQKHHSTRTYPPISLPCLPCLPAFLWPVVELPLLLPLRAAPSRYLDLAFPIRTISRCHQTDDECPNNRRSKPSFAQPRWHRTKAHTSPNV